VLLGFQPAAYRVLSQSHIPAAIVDDHAPGSDLRPDQHFLRCPDYSPGGDDSWLAFMRETAQALASEGRPILFSTTDRGLLAVARHHASLRDNYVLADPGPEAVATLVDKVAFATWARTHGIPTPASIPVRNAAELPRAAELAPLPCIIKPELTFRLELAAGPKLFYAHTRDAIVAYAQRCLSQGLTVILQADLSQGDSIQWSLAGVCDQPGRLAVAVLAQKLRQVPWGAATAVETLPMDGRVLAVAERLCGAIGLTGIFEMELRPGPDGHPCVIEVNPRIWSQVRLPRAAGLDLLAHAYRVAVEGGKLDPAPYRHHIGWLSCRRDLRVLRRMLSDGNLSLAHVASLARVRVVEF
jgi:predicted ATP-grasp superfamily ATP-dependent carboligase